MADLCACVRIRGVSSLNKVKEMDNQCRKRRISNEIRVIIWTKVQ